jgi:hypothetical protein
VGYKVEVLPFETTTPSISCVDIASTEFNDWRRLLSSQLHSHHARKAG